MKAHSIAMDATCKIGELVTTSLDNGHFHFLVYHSGTQIGDGVASLEELAEWLNTKGGKN